MAVKYPKVLEAIRACKTEEVNLGILSADRLEPCILIDYRRHCSAINKGLESEALAIWSYTGEGPCPEI